MNKMLMNKLLRFELNLDYPMDNYSIEDQTNLLINKKINEFISIYAKDFNSKVFVYNYNDDIISLIGYEILLSIKSLYPNFKFYLYGKKRKTKKYLENKQKFISLRKIHKICCKGENNIIAINSYNSIYKVINYNKLSKVFVDYELMEQFTPKEIFIAQTFYHIGYIKKDLIQNNNKDIIAFQNWIEFRGDIDLEKFDIRNLREKVKVLLMKCGDSDEEIGKKMMEVDNSEDVILYFHNGKDLIINDKAYNFILKKTDNRLNEWNNNNEELLNEFKEEGYTIEEI